MDGIKTPEPPIRHNALTTREYQIIYRLRQLRNNGAKLALIELCERGPRVIPVGKPEG